MPANDFKFVNIPQFDSWIVSAPKRATRPDNHDPRAHFCPFDPGSEKSAEEEVYRIGGETGDPNWLVRVVKNKFPFAPIHEVVIHSPQHVPNISELSLDQVRLIIETYVNRFNTHLKSGTVCIFANSGHDAGESINHTHSQIAVVPREVSINVPALEEFVDYRGENLKVKDFMLVAPPFSQWPDEVWVVPGDRGKLFGEINYDEMETVAYILRRLSKILGIRHGEKFPFNYYISPHRDWYLRIIPRAKIIGGFEISTGIYVNTQDPQETMDFIKKHFFEEKEEKIKKNKATYRKGV